MQIVWYTIYGVICGKLCVIHCLPNAFTCELSSMPVCERVCKIDKGYMVYSVVRVVCLACSLSLAVGREYE